MEAVIISKIEFNHMVNELSMLSNSALYKRLLEFEENIKNNKYTREDLGF